MWTHKSPRRSFPALYGRFYPTRLQMCYEYAKSKKKLFKKQDQPSKQLLQVTKKKLLSWRSFCNLFYYYFNPIGVKQSTKSFESSTGEVVVLLGMCYGRRFDRHNWFDDTINNIDCEVRLDRWCQHFAQDWKWWCLSKVTKDDIYTILHITTHCTYSRQQLITSKL